MYYCPKCGTKFKENETYCMNCGERLPDDVTERIHPKRETFNKWWMLPFFSIVFVAVSIGVTTYVLQHNTSKALELYVEAENYMMEGNYADANNLLETSLSYRDNFSQSATAYDFTKDALTIEEHLTEAESLIESQDYEEAIELMSETKNNLNNYTGSAVNLLLESIDQKNERIQLQYVKNKMESDPSMNELRILIWQAEEISHPEADEITSDIRTRIVDYIYTIASEELNEKQFNDALLLAEDGLKYAPESEKLASLITNINKEKMSYESEMQQRMEQAMNTAYEEHQINENNAIEVRSVEVENDSSNQLTVIGEVESVATVPINSILIEYALVHDGSEMLTNEIFVYPETLYPEETGQFEFTHFDLTMDSSVVEPEIKKITWYTE